MIGLLIVSHEPLGTALLHCTRHIFGRLPAQLAALDVIPDENPDQALQAGRDLIARINDGSGVLVLADLYGATPSRVAASLCEPGRIMGVAGVNLPLLIRAIGHRREPLADLVAALQEGAGATFVPLDAACASLPASAERP